MFFRFVLLGILIVIFMFLFDVFIIPMLKEKHKLNQQEKQKKIKHKEFVKKMKELEIK